MLTQTDREDEHPRRVNCNTVKVIDPTSFVSDRQPKRERHLFQQGQSGNPAGRPKGSRAKLAEAFLADVQMHWLVHGTDVIERVARDDPSTYLRVVAGILPKELNVTVSVLDSMSDEDLMTLLQGLRERRRQAQAKVIEGQVDTHALPSPAPSAPVRGEGT